MNHLPFDFADTLAQVLDPADRAEAGEIIKAATRLDDDSLRIFLELFGDRVRASGAPVKQEELREFLRVSSKGGPPTSS